MHDNAPVRVVMTVEYQCSCLAIIGRFWARYTRYNRFKKFIDTLACFCRNENSSVRVKPKVVVNLMFYGRNICGRKVDFVYDRDNLQILLHGEVHVGECLGFDTLRRIDKKKSAFARSYCA